MLKIRRVTVAIALVTVIGMCLTGAPGAGAAQRHPALSADAFRAPGTAQRPRFYWWWPGGAVEDVELRRELAEMRSGGFGGATMTWLGLGVPDADKPPVSTWGTPQWRAHVAAALDAARTNDLRLDLTSATSWPFNSPATTPANGLSSQELVYATQEVAGPAGVDVAVPRPAPSDGATLVAVTAARAASAAGSAKPRMLVAGSAVDVTDHVGADGRLRWNAGEGSWIVFGLWRRPTGQQPTFGETAPGATYAIDHFDRRSVDAATRYLDEHVLAEPVARALRGAGGAIYLDSLEVAAQGLLWTPDFLREFQRRRGYSLVPYLPVLFIAGQHDYFAPGTADDPPDFDIAGAIGERARHDYYETLTDLYIEDQLVPMAAWARARGLSLNGQPAYGTTLDPIRSAAVLPRLETETLANRQPSPVGSPTAAYGLDAYRMTSSGAHIGQANEVGIELGAIFNADYALTLADLKSMADRAYAGGINQIVLHGYPYRTAPGSGWPSWHPFSTELLPFGFGEVWNGVQPQWRHIRGLADYMARNNLAMQSGNPRVDLAVYRDGFLLPDVASADPPPIFAGAALEDAGFTYGFVDPVSLSTRGDAFGGRRLFPGGPAYRALIIDRQATMPAAAAEQILAFARRGLPVVVVGDPPQRGTSLRDAAGEDAAVTAAFSALLREPNVRRVDSIAAARGALEQLGVAPRLRFDRPVAVRSAQRADGDSNVYYLWNSGPQPVSFMASFEATGRPALLDAWSGQIEAVRFQRRGGRTEVPVTLGEGETMLVAFGVHATDAGDGDPRPGAPIALERWHLHVDGSTPSGSDVHDLDLARLQDWREIPAIRDSSGLGTYRTTVDLPARHVAGARLDLGAVRGSFRVRVDGMRVGDRVVAGAPIEIPARLLRARRVTIEVEVATPLRNRLLALGRSGDPGYARFLTREAAGSGAQPAGLLGPVRLVPLGER